MKKLIASITVFSYLLLTTGVVVNYHYCMKRLASVKFYSGETEVCSLCGMDMHASFGCCHDELEVIKLEDDQNKPGIVAFNLQAPEIEPITPSAFLVAAFENVEISCHFQNHSPPLLHDPDIYLQNRVFRI